MFEMNYLHMIRLQIVEDLQEEIEIGDENEEVGPNCNGNYKKNLGFTNINKKRNT